MDRHPPMPQHLETNIAGQPLRLFAGGGAYSCEHDVLLVADAHLGKEATFRRHGIPVPRGSTGSTLAALSRLIAETAATQVVVLGDLCHARSSLSPDVNATIQRFFEQHSAIDFKLVLGNHDRQVGQLPSSWPLKIVEPGYRIGQIMLTHHPQPASRDVQLVVSGHIHPAIQVSHVSDSLGRLRCFWLSANCLVLPAIGEFTGSHTVKLATDDRAWFIAGDEIYEHSQPTRTGASN